MKQQNKLKQLDELTEVFKRYVAFKDRIDLLYNKLEHLEKLEDESLTHYIKVYGYSLGIEEFIINEDNNKDYYYTAEDVDDYIKNNYPDFSKDDSYHLFDAEQNLIALHNQVCESN